MPTCLLPQLCQHLSCERAAAPYSLPYTLPGTKGHERPFRLHQVALSQRVKSQSALHCCVLMREIELILGPGAGTSSGLPAQALAAGFGMQHPGRSNSGSLNRAPQSLPSAGLTSLQQKVILIDQIFITSAYSSRAQILHALVSAYCHTAIMLGTYTHFCSSCRHFCARMIWWQRCWLQRLKPRGWDLYGINSPDPI